MKNTKFYSAFFICVALIGLVLPLARADSLIKTDFEQESFAKTVDYFDYVRAYATLNGIETPQGFEKWHANMYMTYVNRNGLQLLYAGLEDITTDESNYLRIPMQSFIMHYKTNENNRDVILSSTFLMLMAFNETDSSVYPESPDTNDALFASFSLGFDLTSLSETLPALNSKTETIPLTSSEDKLTWTWGMKYTDLTALWWRTWIDPDNPTFQNSWPLALPVYDELTFTYELTINPSTGTATLQEDHVIGRMRHLFVGIIPALWVYCNSTGTYGMLGRQLADDTIYDYIENNGLEMSIINFQTSVMTDHETYSETESGQSVTDTEVLITDNSVNTFADDGEKIFKADFGTKREYKLYNYTEDKTEKTYDTYDSITRTARTGGFAGNGGLFAYHIGLMKFLPAVVVHMYPALFAKAASTISNMERANYFYITSYPQYSGFRVEHDPTFTAYIAQAQSPASGILNGVIGIAVVALVVVAVIAFAALIITRRMPNRGPR